MKKQLLICGFFFLSITLGYTANIKDYKSSGTNFDWSLFNDQEVELYLQTKDKDERYSDIKNLLRAKNSIINGNVDIALFYLQKVNNDKSKLADVKARYMSLIHFIKSNYAKSLSYISSSKFYKSSNYIEVCLLKVMNLLSLNESDLFESEYRRCRDHTSTYSKNNQYWLHNMRKIKMKDRGLLKGDDIENMRSVLENVEITKIWLKLGLYINKERSIARYIPLLPSFSYSSNKIRELIALTYYRIGDIKKSLEFIEDIDSPNAENIRGNIMLNNKKYELAFGHFNLAIKKKNNSINALERAIPLAWLLGQWNEGLLLLEKVADIETDQRKKLSLNTAFKIELEKFKEAKGQLNQLEVLFRNKPPLPVELMTTYVALRQADNNKMVETARNTCKKYIGINCWLLHQSLVWENMGLTTNQDEKILAKSIIDIDELKKASVISRMQEKVIIDQRDIEELDSDFLKIVPN